jgi:hypothetical protein
MFCMGIQVIRGQHPASIDSSVKPLCVHGLGSLRSACFPSVLRSKNPPSSPLSKGERPGATPSRQVSQGLLLLIPYASRLRQQDGLPITNVGSDGNPTEGPVQNVGHDTFVCHPRRLIAGIHRKRNQERFPITHDGSVTRKRNDGQPKGLSCSTRNLFARDLTLSGT